jgi:2-(1,2-epoxy-1,2-dihydrophenyl)acetyl-CoA isomerase
MSNRDGRQLSPFGSSVEYTVDGDCIALITLNRPSRLNAVTPELVQGLCSSVERAIDESVRVAVLTGRGRAFCSGHDLQQGDDLLSESDHRERLERIQDVTRLIKRAPFPVLCAVHGYALGSGCEFALSCDYVVAEEGAEFGFPEVSVGLSVSGGISRHLPLAVGSARARELIFFGSRFDARQALDWGLINRVVPAGSALDIALEAGRKLVELPAAALAIAKATLEQSADSTQHESFEHEIEAAIRLRASGTIRQTIDSLKKSGEVDRPTQTARG